MNRACAPLPRPSSRPFLPSLRRPVLLAASNRLRRPGTPGRHSRHAGQPGPQGRSRRPGRPPRALPRREFALPPSHPPRRHGYRRRKIARLLHPPRRGPTDARHVPYPTPGQKPILRTARIDVLAIHPEAHDATPGQNASVIAFTSSTAPSLRRRRRPGPHLGDLRLRPGLEQSARIIGSRADVTAGRAVSRRRPQARERRRLEPYPQQPQKGRGFRTRQQIAVALWPDLRIHARPLGDHGGAPCGRHWRALVTTRPALSAR